MASLESSVVAFFRSKFTEKNFRPYALAIGQSALAWNDLHEHLGRLFVSLIYASSKEGWAIWHSSILDRAKRAMIEALAKDVESGPVVDEVNWLLKETNKLEDLRNNAIHAPLLMTTTLNTFTPGIKPREIALKSKIEAHDWTGNPRAKRISRKDILSEYRYTRIAATTLRDFTISLVVAIENEHVPLPQRPRLPTRRGLSADQ